MWRERRRILRSDQRDHGAYDFELINKILPGGPVQLHELATEDDLFLSTQLDQLGRIVVTIILPWRLERQKNT